MLKIQEESSSILRVLNDLILVEEDKMDKYEGSLEIPDMYKGFYEKIPGSGTVLSWGPDVKISELRKQGQRVIFGKHAGHRFERHGKRLQLIREYDIQCLILSPTAHS